jgi:hypothetical protein
MTDFQIFLLILGCVFYLLQLGIVLAIIHDKSMNSRLEALLNLIPGYFILIMIYLLGSEIVEFFHTLGKNIIELPWVSKPYVPPEPPVEKPKRKSRRRKK